ncbi:hypothetical protein [Zavarzinella formosa]|uniref:hypothetical protein n=1 Tax=Zavarzinella formosa TaxID=360055 RepID=UPI00031D3C48|nr:hypothetical protein [Zavarzinella formosa]
MDQHEREEAAGKLARIRVAYDVLSYVWNGSYSRPVREAIRQDDLIKIMKPLHEHIKRSHEALYGKPEDDHGEMT